jgi:hypothetical protein
LSGVVAGVHGIAAANFKKGIWSNTLSDVNPNLAALTKPTGSP